MSKLVRVSLSIEDNLFTRLSKLVQDNGYENRSEFIRDLIRDRIVNEQWNADGEVVATLTIVYNHHQRGLTEKLVERQHHSGGHVLASTHVHLSHHLCAEMIMLRGQGEEIRRLAASMQKLRGVQHAELSLATSRQDIP